jgi:hypothetical protein
MGKLVIGHSPFVIGYIRADASFVSYITND